MACTLAWFWVVAAHRIDEAPLALFEAVFSTNCGDFEHFYFAARAMREGSDLYASGVHGYIYPPLIAFLFIPLTFLSVQTAAVVMLVVNLGIGLACAFVAAAEAMRRLDLPVSRERLLVVAAVTLLLAAPKLRNEFQMWQTNALMMLALLLALRWLDARPVLAGLLLGAAVNIKYLPLVLLPYLLLRRRHRAAVAFVAGVIVFAWLPSLQSGWQTNLHDWRIALSGLARLFGANTVARGAHIDPITVGHSISVTSGISRLLGPSMPPAAAWAVSAAVAAALLLVLVVVYRRGGVPLVRWPDAVAQRGQPWLGMIAFEWPAVIALALAFGPQTNSRHTSLLLMVFPPLAAMVLYGAANGQNSTRRDPVRILAAAAIAILFFGLVLPPNTEALAAALAEWRRIGGAGWCIALMLPFYLAAVIGMDGQKPAAWPSRRGSLAAT